MTPPQPGADDTVRLTRGGAKPPVRTGRRAWLVAAGIVGGACLLGGIGVLVWPPHPPPSGPAPATIRVPAPPVVAPPTPAPAPAPPPAPAPAPEFAIRSATEAEIRADMPTGLTIFRFAPDRRILVLDFASLHEQAMMLNRVAALVEKAGLPRDHVLTEAALAQAIRASGDTPDTYYYGHDYSAAALVRFFSLADQQQIALDPEEQALHRLLRQVGWLKPDVHAAVISIPAVGADANVTLSARGTILHHELSHGLFFSDPAYAAFVHRFWDTALTARERDNVRKFLGSEGYDMGDEELMYNEMQAYLMFTRDPEFFSPERVGMTPWRLAELETEFLRGMPTGWLHDSLATTPVIIPASAH